MASKSERFAPVVDHPWRVIALTILVAGGLGYFMQFLAPSITFRDLLGPGFPGLADYDYVQAEYTKDDNALVMIEAVNGNPFTEEILAGVHALTAELWTAPYSVRVDAITNFQHSEASGDDLRIGDLIPDPNGLSAGEIARIREIAMTDPLAVNRVVNPSGNVLAVNVIFDFPQLDINEKLEAVAFVRAAAERFEGQHAGTNVYVGGLTPLDTTVMTISMNESGLFMGLTLLIVVGLLSVLLRSVRAVMVCVPVLLLSVASAMALAGALGWKLTPFTSSVPMIVLVIAVADCVHLLTAYVSRLRAGDARRRALRSALDQNARPIIVTSVTTAIGFLTLTFSDSISIDALGLQSAFGILFAGGLSLTFLPAMLSLVELRVKPGAGELGDEIYVAITERIFAMRVPVLGISALLVAFLGFQATTNVFEDNIPTYFDESLPWRTANDFADEQFGSVYLFSYSISGAEPGAVSDPAYLRDVETFANYLRTLPKVAYVQSITDVFKRLNRNMHGDDPAEYDLPQSRELAAQYLLLYEMSLPYGLDLNTQINMDKSATKLTAAFQTLSVREILALEQQVDAWAAENLPDLTYITTGAQPMFAKFMDTSTRSLTMGAIYGLILISGLLIFMLRSFKIGAISLLPNLAPVVLAFGVWGLFVGQVGFGLAMVSGITIGIIIDDTVHFLAKYLDARGAKGLSAKDAVTYTYRTVGKSIVFTTLVLVVGFLAMAVLSNFRVNSDMGRMTAIIMTFALFFDLVTLPALLMVFDRGPARAKA